MKKKFLKSFILILIIPFTLCNAKLSRHNKKTNFKKTRNATSQTSGLDTSFGRNGVNLTSMSKLFGSSGRDIASSIVVQPDNRIIAAGYSTALKNVFTYALSRYLPNGKFDTSFGDNGLVLTDIGAVVGEPANTVYSFIASSVLQPDGKLVVGGSSQFGSNIVCSMARYNINGTLDQLFGNKGVVITDINKILGNPNAQNEIDALGLQSNGKIIAAGIDSPALKLTMVRYNINGTIDKTFGTSNNGIVSTNFGFSSNIAIQPDDKILAGGFVNNEFAITRYNADGTLDTNFGTNGVVITNFGAGSFVSSIAIQAGSIVAGGQLVDKARKSHYLVAKYNLDGSPDNSFGNNGTINLRLPKQININQLVIQPDNKIVTLGTNFDLIFALTRLNIDGSFDDSFGKNGISAINLGIDYLGSISFPNSLLLQADGKIVAAGSNDAVDSNKDFFLERYNNDGSLDKTYGGVKLFDKFYKGVVDTDFKRALGIKTGSSNSITAIGVQSTGKIIAAGVTDALDPNYDFGAFRYDANGIVDQSVPGFALNCDDFSTTGSPDFGSYDILTCLAINPDDSIILGGYSDTLDGFFSFALTKLTSGGDAFSGFGDFPQILPLAASVTNFGLTINQVPTNDIMTCIILQNNGQILAAGNTTANPGITSSFALARYSSTGFLDNNFGKLKKGIVITNIGKNLGSKQSFDSIESIALQTDNKIVVGGFSTAKNPLGDFALARYNSNGTLDNTFGNKGIVITNFNPNKLNGSQINKVIIQPDGKILAGGISSSQIKNFKPNNPTFNFAIIRYNQDGTIDTSFGNKGFVITQISPTSNDYLSCMTLLNGTIIAGGSSNAVDPHYDFTLAVYDSNGNLKTSVGNKGIIFTDFNKVLGLGSGSQDSINANGMAIQGGKVLGAGSTNATNPNFDFAIARYNIPTTPPPPICNVSDIFLKTIFNKYGK
ncbi:MAG: hypothetical protein P4L22_06735 [Candidatus Babeliales bacterium]|nr:hypothetical protein [Candidatus Babeliales bacterium]